MASPSSCWLWLGATDAWGRGVFSEWDALKRRTRTWRALHLAILLTGGEIPPGVRLRLRCATPECVNPRHAKGRDIAYDAAKLG